MTEKQIIDFWNKHALDYRLGKISEFGLIERAAQHFYNMALENVKKEIEANIFTAKEAKDAELYKCGVIHGLNSIMAYIDIEEYE